MQFVECNIGTWKAQARIEDVDNGKILAVISTHNDVSSHSEESKHTIVFDHQPGCDRLEETKTLMQEIFRSRYGNWKSEEEKQSVVTSDH